MNYTEEAGGFMGYSRTRFFNKALSQYHFMKIFLYE